MAHFVAFSAVHVRAVHELMSVLLAVHLEIGDVHARITNAPNDMQLIPLIARLITSDVLSISQWQS